MTMQNYDTHYLNPMPTKRQLNVLDTLDELAMLNHEQQQLYAMEEEDMTDEQIKRCNQLHAEIRALHRVLDGEE
jgi:hypothetical protein